MHSKYKRKHTRHIKIPRFSHQNLPIAIKVIKMQKVSENQTDLRPPESNAALKLMNLPILVHPVIT